MRVEWDEGDLVYIDWDGTYDPCSPDDPPPNSVFWLDRARAVELWQKLGELFGPATTSGQDGLF